MEGGREGESALPSRAKYPASPAHGIRSARPGSTRPGPAGPSATRTRPARAGLCESDTSADALMHAHRPAVLFAGLSGAHAAGPPSTARCIRSLRSGARARPSVCRCAQTPTAHGLNVISMVELQGSAKWFLVNWMVMADLPSVHTMATWSRS